MIRYIQKGGNLNSFDGWHVRITENPAGLLSATYSDYATNSKFVHRLAETSEIAHRVASNLIEKFEIEGDLSNRSEDTKYICVYFKK